MITLNTRNVHQALPQMIGALYKFGQPRDTRNGPVLQMPQPTTVLYQHPLERVLFWPQRDANPFFHFMEVLWMLAGRNDVEFVATYAKNMRSFSDDGVSFNAAYGDRWRKHFHKDQLVEIIMALRKNPNCRRQVLAMWDGAHDLGLESKDLPCNTHAYFQIGLQGELNMMVCNRSNDIIWGMLGANAVHFSALLEYMAACIGVPIGRYWQTSMNAHGYLATLEPLKNLSQHVDNPQGIPDPYLTGIVRPGLMITPSDNEHWYGDLQMFMSEGSKAMGYRTRFFRKIAVVVYQAHMIFRELEAPDKYTRALEHLQLLPQDLDWKLAMEQWLTRRLENWQAKQKAQDDGVSYDTQATN